MKLFKTMITVVTLFTLSACANVYKKAEAPEEGLSATDCFAAGGTIDTSSGTSMCILGEGESKPIL